MAELTSKMIAKYLLHEIGHAYAFGKYGTDDPRADDPDNKLDEAYANGFSTRWLRRLCKEGWFS